MRVNSFIGINIITFMYAHTVDMQKLRLRSSINSKCANFWFLENRVPVFCYKSIDYIAYW